MAWKQIADHEEADLTDYDGFSAAWDKEVDAVADFDGEDDVGNSLNDHADAAHDGAVGLEVTFTAVVSHGYVDHGGDQTQGFATFWFNPNTVGLSNTKQIWIAQGTHGVGGSWVVIVDYATGIGYRLLALVINDASSGEAVGTWVPITDDWHEIDVWWERASGVGQNDGVMRMYIDGVLEAERTNIDNDTVPLRYVYVGMSVTNEPSPSGSYYIDTLKIDPIGAPFASKLAAKNGNYGMACPVSSTQIGTGCYSYFTDPSVETIIMAECWFDINTLTMAPNDEFWVIWSNGEFYLLLKKDGPNYTVALKAEEDAGSQTTSYYTITDDWHQFRVIWGASGGSDNGFALLYVDKVLKESLAGLDNDTLTSASIGCGPFENDAGTYGIVYYDDCQWDDAVQFLITTAGSLDFTGAVISLRMLGIDVAGVLDFAGTLAKSVLFKRSAAGALDLAGGVTYTIFGVLNALVRLITSPVGAILHKAAPTADVEIDESPEGRIRSK